MNFLDLKWPIKFSSNIAFTNYIYYRNGYTIIEVLIVIFVMLLMFLVGQASLRDFSRRQSLQSVERLVFSDMKLAQEYALTGRKPPGCQTLHGYLFTRQSAKEYAIEAYCFDGLGDKYCLGGGNSDFCIKRDIKLDSLQGYNLFVEPVNAGPPKNNAVLFKVLNSGTNSSSDIVIRIVQLSTGEEKVITVTPQGEIR